VHKQESNGFCEVSRGDFADSAAFSQPRTPRYNPAGEIWRERVFVDSDGAMSAATTDDKATISGNGHELLLGAD